MALWFFQAMLKIVRFSKELSWCNENKSHRVRDPKGLRNKQVKTDRMMSQKIGKGDRGGGGDMREAANKGALLRE